MADDPASTIVAVVAVFKVGQVDMPSTRPLAVSRPGARVTAAAASAKSGVPSRDKPAAAKAVALPVPSAAAPAGASTMGLVDQALATPIPNAVTSVPAATAIPGGSAPQDGTNDEFLTWLLQGRGMG